MITSQALLQEIRYRIDEWRSGVALASQESRYLNDELLRYADDAQVEIARRLQEVGQWYLGVVATESYVAATQSYALPPRCMRVVGIVRTDTEPDKVLELVGLWGEQLLGASVTWPDWFGATVEGWRLFGDKIRISPTPESAATSNIDIYYIAYPPKMQYGTAQAAAATSLTLAATPTVGDAVLRADYFNSTVVECTAGTLGTGARTHITDYSAALVCTTDTWPTTPTGTITYDIGTQVPDHYDEGVILGARERALRKSESKLWATARQDYENYLNRLALSASLRTDPAGGVDYSFDDYA